ncbi:MAG: peptidoglycan DD-metalloendopeptidase family protein [Candidatus Pelagadaptatus aseana]|uniref:OapA family protein n=1 Tax=Candidatus Pelagadaptatus aseana TaxID=3120508 RepID=UPI0039B30E8C
MQRTENHKKKQISALLNAFPKQHLMILAGLVTTLLAFLIIPTSDQAEAKRSELPLAIKLLPQQHAELLAKTETPVAPKFEEPAWHLETVKPGDNLSLIFQRAGLSDRALYEFMAANKAASALKRIHPGHKIEFQIEDRQLQALQYSKDPLSTLKFTRNGTSFDSEQLDRQPDLHTAYREATINDSLFMAGKRAQMDANLIMELANIFGWDVDFALDIRQGDSFKVMYQEKFLDGEKLGNGPILAAEFINQGRAYKAVRYEDSKGNVHYYTPEGHTMRKEFLRTPVDFARISSHFNLRRKHPVLNKIRAHKGTDYAAPRGTPIKAAGDGKVIHAGRKGGYGNTVIIQHGQTYKTLYAHLNKFRRGVRSGSRVKQGQIIGYVGSTGLATGPHLHYEFYVNGAVRNPVTVKLPKAKSIAKSELNRFKQQTQPLLANMDGFHQQTLYAQAANTNQQQDNG